MPFRNAPVRIADGAWIGAQAFVAPGVEIGTEAVIAAGSVVTRSQPARMVCTGNPCTPVKPRWRKDELRESPAGSNDLNSSIPAPETTRLTAPGPRV
jgi:acetyltransferase-like isoleucine patch superfamily enzyme